MITKWNYPAEHWERLLAAEGFDAVSAEIIPAPVEDRLGTLLVRGLVP